MKKWLAIILSVCMLVGLVACAGGGGVEVPSKSDARRAAEKKYDMDFVLDEQNIASDGSKAEWVFISDDETLQVTVTWDAKHPDEFDFDDKELKSGDSGRETTEPDDTEDTKGTTAATTAETAATTTTEEPYYNPDVPTYGSGSKVINLWSFTNEVPNMVAKYIQLHPEFGDTYTVECTVIATDGGAYQTALDSALAAGGSSAPDIYAAEAAFILKYSQGDMAQYAATYKDLGIDVDTKCADAEIAPYTIDIGSRNGEVVALGYQATGGAMIYRASIAQEVFGTSDPSEIEKIVGAGSGNWDKFWEAAYDLKSYGYAIVSGADDMWNVCEKSATQAWLNGDDVVIAPEREEFLDIAKKLKDEGLSNDTGSWSEAWYADMADSNVFCFFGPAWLINYVMIGNCGGTSVGEGSYGDWRVCAPPVGFFWGGTWILANKDTDQAVGVATLIEWITLDTSETGLQYLWANDMMGNGAKDTVASNVVMAKSDGTLAFCGGQNVFPAFIAGNANASGKAMTQYDESINTYFKDAATQYANGEIDRDAAIELFRENVEWAFGF